MLDAVLVGTHVRWAHTAPHTHFAMTTRIQYRDAPFSFATMRLRREELPHHSGELNHSLSQ